MFIGFFSPPIPVHAILSGIDKRVVSQRVVLADVPPERKPERGYLRQNHPFTKPPFYLPVIMVALQDPMAARWRPRLAIYGR